MLHAGWLSPKYVGNIFMVANLLTEQLFYPLLYVVVSCKITVHLPVLRKQEPLVNAKELSHSANLRRQQPHHPTVCLGWHAVHSCLVFEQLSVTVRVALHAVGVRELAKVEVRLDVEHGLLLLIGHLEQHGERV